MILRGFFRGFHFIQLASIPQLSSDTNSRMALDKNAQNETMDGCVGATEHGTIAEFTRVVRQNWYSRSE